MGWERGHAQSGQASGEFAILLGGVVLVCIVAALLFAGVLRTDYRSSGEQLQQPAAPPAPIPTAPHTWPTTFAECEDGGWTNFPQFENEDECVEYVDGLTP